MTRLCKVLKYEDNKTKREDEGNTSSRVGKMTMSG